MERARNGTRRLWIVGICLIMGCHSYRPAAAAPAGQRVRVRFAPERDLWITRPKGEPFKVVDILVMEGDVTNVRGDTVDFNVSGLRNEDGYLPLSGYRGGRTTIVHGQQSTLEVRRFSGPRTALTVLGVGLAALSAAALVWVIGMSQLE